MIIIAIALSIIIVATVAVFAALVMSGRISRGEEYGEFYFHKEYE